MDSYKKCIIADAAKCANRLLTGSSTFTRKIFAKAFGLAEAQDGLKVSSNLTFRSHEHSLTMHDNVVKSSQISSTLLDRSSEYRIGLGYQQS